MYLLANITSVGNYSNIYIYIYIYLYIYDKIWQNKTENDRVLRQIVVYDATT